MSKRYIYFDCDDPYKMLAMNLVAALPPFVITEMLESEEAVRREAEEDILYGMDLAGYFGDCIVDMLISSNKTKWERTQKLITDELIKNLDIPRLQRELGNVLVELKLSEPTQPQPRLQEGQP